MKHLLVTAAVFKREDQYLALQRGISKFDYMTHKFEFPGGKVEPNETLEVGLMRELKEELNLDVLITPEMHLMTVNHNYPDFKITLEIYLVEVSTLDFVLHEHVSYKWCKASELNALDFADADLPIVSMLMNQL